MDAKFVDATPFASSVRKGNGHSSSQSAKQNGDSCSLDKEFGGSISVSDEENEDSQTNMKESASTLNELGSVLKEHGFNYHGLEVLYSGVLGKELACEIFIGPVYYQRLRHMVSDKFQVILIDVLDSCLFFSPYNVNLGK